MIEKLTGAGHTDKPPSNLLALIDTFGLDARDMRQVFSKVADSYPKGPTLNLVG